MSRQQAVEEAILERRRLVNEAIDDFQRDGVEGLPFDMHR